MSKRDAWMALFIYFVSAEVVWTLVSIKLPWTLWLLGQPLLFVLSVIIVAVTFGGKDK